MWVLFILVVDFIEVPRWDCDSLLRAPIVSFLRKRCLRPEAVDEAFILEEMGRER